MTNIVGSGNEADIAEFAKDDFQFNGPGQEIQKLGEQIFKNHRGLQEAQLDILIGVYRLSIGNIMNVLGKRATDLNTTNQLYKQLQTLVKQAGELGPHLRFENFQTEGFELVPQSWFDDLPNLQGLHIKFGELL